MKKVTIVFLVIFIGLLIFSLLNTFTAPKKISNAPLKIAFEYYSKNKLETKENSTTIVLDKNYSDCFAVTSNKDLEYIKIITIDENFNQIDVLFKEEDIQEGHTFNFCYILSETVPNLQIIFKEKNGKVHTFTPIYNGKDGTYKFEKLSLK